jgi:hypothetical protein
MAWDRFELKIKLSPGLSTPEEVAWALQIVVNELKKGKIEGDIYNHTDDVGDYSFKSKHEDNDE